MKREVGATAHIISLLRAEDYRNYPPSTGAHSKAASTFLLLTAQSKVLIVLKDTQHIIYYFIFLEVGVVMDLGQT